MDIGEIRRTEAILGRLAARCADVAGQDGAGGAEPAVRMLAALAADVDDRAESACHGPWRVDAARRKLAADCAGHGSRRTWQKPGRAWPGSRRAWPGPGRAGIRATAALAAAAAVLVTSGVAVSGSFGPLSWSGDRARQGALPVVTQPPNGAGRASAWGGGTSAVPPGGAAGAAGGRGAPRPSLPHPTSLANPPPDARTAEGRDAPGSGPQAGSDLAAGPVGSGLGGRVGGRGSGQVGGSAVGPASAAIPPGTPASAAIPPGTPARPAAAASAGASLGTAVTGTAVAGATARSAASPANRAGNPAANRADSPAASAAADAAGGPRASAPRTAAPRAAAPRTAAPPPPWQSWLSAATPVPSRRTPASQPGPGR